MNTNDPKAPYTVKLHGPIEAATAPLLSAAEFDRMRVEAVEKGEHEHERVFNAAASVLEFYEAKIRSGELRVVKIVKLNKDGECPSCGSYQYMPRNAAGESMVTPFCSNCGDKITEG